MQQTTNMDRKAYRFRHESFRGAFLELQDCRSHKEGSVKLFVYFDANGSSILATKSLQGWQLLPAIEAALQQCLAAAHVVFSAVRPQILRVHELGVVQTVDQPVKLKRHQEETPPQIEILFRELRDTLTETDSSQNPLITLGLAGMPFPARGHLCIQEEAQLQCQIGEDVQLLLRIHVVGPDDLECCQSRLGFGCLGLEAWVVFLAALIGDFAQVHSWCESPQRLVAMSLMGPV